MLASRERTLGAARQRGESVGQIAVQELEAGLTPCRAERSAASDVASPRLPLAPRTTRAAFTLILSDVSTARMSLSRLESLRAVRRHTVDGSGFAAVNRLRRLCQGGCLITAAA